MKQTLIQLWERAWAERVKFAKYVIVGISSVAIDLSFFFLFVKLFHFRPTIALVFYQPLVLAFNFLMNKHWSFGSKGASHREFVRYLILTLWNYLFSIGAMHFGHDILLLPAVAVRLCSIACMVLWNFALFKFWVYREKNS